MRKLPNGYYNLNLCYTDGYHYIDTGITPTDDVDVELAFSIKTSSSSASTRYYIFGARDGTSNTSLGINLCKTFNNGYYVGYRTTNTLISSTKGNFSPIGYAYQDIDFSSLSIFNIKNKTVSLTETPSYKVEDKTSVASFSGTNTMYLFGLNNNGSVLYAPSSSGIAYCKIWKNKLLVRDYLACRDENDNVGLYDFVNNTFHHLPIYPAYDYYAGTFDILPTTNGNGSVDGMIGKYLVCGELKANPNDGYIFSGWEMNEEILSNQNPLPYSQRSLFDLGLNHRDTFSPKAIFIKKSDVNAFVGYRMAIYSSNPLRFDDGKEININKGVYSIKSARISVDGRQKTSAIFNINDKFNVSIGDYVYVYSQFGKNIFNGIIQGYDETSITCGSMNYLFNKDIILHSNTSRTIRYNTGNGEAAISVPNASVSYSLTEVYLLLLRSITDIGYSGVDVLEIPSYWFNNIGLYYNPVSYSVFANETYGDYVMCNYPIVNDTSVANLYDVLCNIYSELNIYVKDRCVQTKYTRDNVQYDCLEISFVPLSVSQSVITLGSNNEQVSNVKIIEESDNTSILFIFNSAGNVVRGVYTINENGEIEYNNSFAKRPSVYMPKVVLSDDNLNTVIKSNLTASKFNHKITFDLMLDDKHNFRFDDFNINTRIDFYYNNKVYRSVITAISYDIIVNSNEIQTLHITLGMARNNLTSKLNLGKVKK